jgi:hypothetical protein
MNTDESLSILRDVQFDHYADIPEKCVRISGVVQL